MVESYRRRPEFGASEPGLWLGEAGIVLVAWLLAPARSLEDRLAELVVVDPDNDTLELLWGSPGLLLIADVMLARTGDDRWQSAWLSIADHLMGQWGARVPGFWTQRIQGSSQEILGPAHGLAGVVDALGRRPDLLPRDRLVPGTAAVVEATAIREGALANWPPALDDPLVHSSGTIRTQWCHGAPGIVASLAALPQDDRLDPLLLAGGELTWTAGPLRKGPGLCHGTAGNGFALLKLFTRTGDERWLERAKRFAMHSAAQVEAARREYGRGRYSLWTGDVGTAIFLGQCLDGTSLMPALNAW